MPRVNKYSELAPKKRAFVEHYLRTNNIIDSYFDAGYMEGRDRTDQTERMRAYRSGREILAIPMVRDYVAMNKPIVIPQEGEIDEKEITDRLNLIMMGQIEQQVLVKGQLHYVKPSFRDQIEAGKVLVSILEKREKQSNKKASKALTGKVQSLIGSARTEVVSEQ